MTSFGIRLYQVADLSVKYNVTTSGDCLYSLSSENVEFAPAGAAQTAPDGALWQYGTGCLAVG